MDDELFRHAEERLNAMRLSPSAHCKVCGGEAYPFDIVDFNKSCEDSPYPIGLSIVPVIYRICRQCQFIFTDFFDDFTSEQWSRYVYNKDYVKFDPEYLSVRPRINAHMLRTFLARRKQSVIGLDYGGGNGTTAAMLRAKGWNFDCYDPFGQTNMSPGLIGRYNFCSAIEVFEHTPDPVKTLRDVIEKTTTGPMMVMISTVISDGAVSNETRLSWWYAAPRNGHVSLYSRKSLQTLGAQFGLRCTLIGSGPFFLTRGFTENQAHMFVLRGKLLRRLQFLNRKFYAELTRRPNDGAI